MNNNDNLYNILNNFNKLSESDTPKPAAQPKPKTLLESTMEQVLQEKYMGFKKTVGALKKQGGVENPEALAASIGRKKYGKKAFQKAAAAGKKMGESQDWMKDMQKTAADMQAKHPLPPRTQQTQKPKAAPYQLPHKSKEELDAGIKKQMAKYYSDNDDTKRHMGDSYEPTENMVEDDEAVAAFLARGGEIQHGKSQRGPKRSGASFASKHIGSASGRGNTKGKVSGLGANTGKSGKPVVTAEQGVAEGYNDLGPEYGGAGRGRSADAMETAKLTRQAKAAAAKAGKTFNTSAEYRLWHMKQKSKKQGVAEESDWSNLGAEYRSTKPGTREPTHTGEKEYFKGGVRHTKNFDKEVSHTAATGEKRGRGRPKKSQFESHNTIDRLIAEAFGDDDNKEQSLNYEQDQLRNSIGDDLFAELQRSVSSGDYDFSDNLFQALYDHYFDEMPYETAKARDGDPYEWIGDRIGEVFADDVQEQAETFPVQDRRGDIKGTGPLDIDLGPVKNASVRNMSTVEIDKELRKREPQRSQNRDEFSPEPDVEIEEGQWQDIDDRSAPVKGANQKIKTIEPGSAIRVDPNYKDPTTTTAPKDNGMGRIVQGVWQADPKGTVKAPSGDPEGVKEADDAYDPFANDPAADAKHEADVFAKLQQQNQQGKGTKIKDMNPLDRNQYLQSTNRAWDEKTQRIMPAQPKQAQQKEDIMMTNELAEMMRLAGMSEGKKSKPDYLDFDKDGDKKEPMKSALKDKKVDESEEKADKDYDGDGKVETGKEEYLGSKIAAAKKAGKLKEGEKANEEKCDECGMYESKCKCDASLEEALNQMRRIAGLKETCMSPISGDMGDMQQQQGKMNISTNMSSDGNKSVTITADGDSALELMQMLKLAGMGGHGGEEMHQQEEPEGIMVVAQDAGEEAHEEEVDETKDTRYQANTTPEEHVYPEQVLTKGGDGEVAGKEKAMHKHGYQFGDNPMAMKESMKLMKDYESIKIKK